MCDCLIVTDICFGCAALRPLASTDTAVCTHAAIASRVSNKLRPKLTSSKEISLGLIFPSVTKLYSTELLFSQLIYVTKVNSCNQIVLSILSSVSLMTRRRGSRVWRHRELKQTTFSKNISAKSLKPWGLFVSAKWNFRVCFWFCKWCL